LPLCFARLTNAYYLTQAARKRTSQAVHPKCKEDVEAQAATAKQEQLE
jgi:hypothetical protein